MRKVRIATWVMALCMLCLVGTKADESSILQYAMSAEKEEVEWGNTITLAESLTIQVPADWVKMEEEDPELEGVGYTGTDSEGNAVALITMRGDETFGSLQLSKKRLEKIGTDYTATTFHGIDMLIVHDNLADSGILEALFCMKNDGTPLLIGFQMVSGDVMQSKKLKKDVTAIVHSIQVVDAGKLLSFEDTLPGDAALEAELFPETDQPKMVIPYGEGTPGMMGLLPNELLQDGYGLMADAGKITRDIFWAVETNGTLHITGTGAMDENRYEWISDAEDVPWAKYCDRITGVVIHEGVTKVINYTFSSCPNMKTIQIASTVTDIDDRTIWTSGVEEINVDPWNSAYTSVEGVLYDREMHELICFPPHKEDNEFSIPGTVTRICSFAGSGLKSILIPDQVTQIDAGAFAHCESLQGVVLSSNLDILENEMFYGDSNLLSVTIPDSVTRIGSSVFYGCGESMNIYYQGSKEQWNRISIGEENYSLMTGTVHFGSEAPFTAMQDGEFIWDSLWRTVTSRIGKVERENAKTEELGQTYQYQIPEDWETNEDGDFIGKDEDGITTRMHINIQPFDGYQGNGLNEYYNARITKETLNGVNINFVENYSPYNEFFAIFCWDAEYIYRLDLKLENNMPLRSEKLADDVAYIIGSLCKIGHQATGEIIFDVEEDESRCMETVRQFYFRWSSQSWNNMLEYCSMEWKEKQNETLKANLMKILPDGDPLMCESNDLTIEGDHASVDVKILLDHDDGKEPVNYHFIIRLVREGNEWRIDPESLMDYEVLEESIQATEQEEHETQLPESTNTPAPKAMPIIPEGFEHDDEISESCWEILEKFMQQWSINSIDGMLEYCSAMWKTGEDNPKFRMFALMTNKTPLAYTLNEIKSLGDDAYADMVILIDRKNGKDSVNYRFCIHLVKEADEWHVDPESIENTYTLDID